MYKKIIRLVFVGYMVILFIACSGSSQNTIKPKKHLACETSSQFIESYGSDQSLLRAVGKGKKIADIKLSAKKDALCFILTKGSKPILNTSQARKQFASISHDIYEDVNKYTSIQGDEKSRREEDGLYVFEYIVAVQTTTLTQDLVEKKIIKSTKSLAKSLGAQSFLVLSKNKKNKKNKISITVMKNYLNDRKFDVIQDGSIDEHNLKSTIAALTAVYGERAFVNKKFAKILNTGADVYVKVDTKISYKRVSGTNTNKATVTLSAYEVATNKYIAGAVGYSAQREAGADKNSIIAEATNDAADEVTKGVKIKWKDYIEDGKPFRILLVVSETNNFRSIERKFYKSLRSISEDVNRLHKGAIAVDYVAKVKNTPKGIDLFDKIVESYKGPGELVDEEMTNNFILIRVKESSSDLEIN